MSTETRLNRIELELAATGAMTRRDDGPRITIRRQECAEAFDAFAAQHPPDRRTFEDFRDCMIALEAQRNGASK